MIRPEYRPVRTPPRIGLRLKWTLGASALVAVASLAAFFYVPTQLQRQAGIALAEQGANIAEVAAFAASEALADGRRTEVQAVLDGTSRLDGVVYAVVEDTTGDIVAEHRLDRARQAEYRDAAADACPWCVTPGPAALDVLPVSVSVRDAGAVVGRLHLGLARAPLRAQVAEARVQVGLLCLLALLLGVAGAFALSSIVTEPLDRISAVVERVAVGDLTHRAEVRSDDEVGRLASAFNAMIDEVQSAQAELRAINESLEERVEDRTSELQDALTRRDRAEDANRLLFAALEQSAEVLLVGDAAGVVRYVNPAYERLRGVTADEVVGRNALAKLRVEFGDAFVDDVIETIRTEPHWIGQIERPRADGSTYLQRTTVTAVRDPEGDVTGFVAVGQDVTREVELQNRLYQAQKMEAVGQLAGGLAHDFKHLLNTVQSHAQVLLSDPEGRDVRRGLEQITSAAERASGLTRQLLAFSGRQILRPEPVLLDAVLRDIAPILSSLTPKSTVLHVEVGVTEPRVVIDRSQLEQMLMDLVLNACDAIDDAGEIVVSVDRVPRKEAPKDWEFEGDDPVLRLTVEDNGHGIAPERVGRVFDPFFTTKEVGEGAGLGLSTVYGTMQQSGGAVSLESEVGVGTRVCLYFAEARIGLGEEDEPDAIPRESEAPCVLVVDDEPLVRSLVRRYLEREGYHVVEAHDGEAAWDLLLEAGDRIDLLLSDVRMPRMDGLTLAGKAAERFESLGIVLMSGYSAEIARGAAPPYPLIAKPFGRDELLDAVRDATGAGPR